MILARVAVWAAVCCSLYFNGSYAYSKAHDQTQQLAMVAVALSIDLAKCGFLPAASAIWAQGLRLAPTVLVLLWPLAFGYSLFSGYASVATNRSDAGAIHETQAQARTRTQATYDQATTSLATAKQSPAWNATAACTLRKTTKHTTFCDSVDDLIEQQRIAAEKLDTTRLVTIDPEVALLASFSTLPRPTLAIAIAFAPALILELVSSLGLYATRSPPRPQPSRRRLERFFERQKQSHSTEPQNAPKGPPDASRVVAVSPSNRQPQKDDIFVWDLPP